MTPEELTMHASVITDETLDNMYSNISNYMEDVLKIDPYREDCSAVHDELFWECMKVIRKIKIERGE
jgi:hypothetical protein